MQYNQGSYLPQIESIDISFKQIQELEDSTAEEVAALRRRGQDALNSLGAKESVMMKAFQEKQEASKSSTKSAVQADGAFPLALLILSVEPHTHRLSPTATGTPLKSPLSATVRSIEVSVGETLDQVKVAVVLEAMKTEVSVNVPRALKGKTVSAIAVVAGDVISAGQALLYCE